MQIKRITVQKKITILFGVFILFFNGCGATHQPTKQSAKSIQVGHASFYGKAWSGRLTANGERFNHRAMTAAHKTLPFHTRVRVTLLSTGKSVIVRINDRGPFIKGRIIDLSDEAARRIGLIDQGVGQVKIEILD
jgi:rare lipoprotein A